MVIFRYIELRSIYGFQFIYNIHSRRMEVDMQGRRGKPRNRQKGHMDDFILSLIFFLQ